LHKRGVSPLIATVLLIAFSVALGAIIMSWGRSFVTTQTDTVGSQSAQEMRCSLDVAVDWLIIGDEYQVCHGSRGVNVTVQNVGNIDITGIKIQAIDSSGMTFNGQGNRTLSPGDAYRFDVVLSEAGGISDVRQITVMPMIDVQGSAIDRFCTNARIEVEEIGYC